KITVERPLRLNFQASEERIARLEAEKSFQGLAKTKKKGAAGIKEIAEGEALQAGILAALRGMSDELVKDREAFTKKLQAAFKEPGLKVPAPAMKAALSALSERDETAPPCTGRDGNPEPDSELRDTENVPLGARI